jgi:hypothetical protein
MFQKAVTLMHTIAECMRSLRTTYKD